ncbi:ABC transporter permease [Agrilactobacillus yilanensis]|uniref:ABC transporter permease n=1 Tax=Agrilactobacillus yilanensis TaxID=2485997 RepID=A0ABW4J6L7_9LACO|nr:ABC transporter permease [Agrilactobacillus yilanensis]
MSLLTSAIGQGLLYGILGIGLFLSFRILRFPDMTIEGSFPLGAAVCVTAIVNGVPPIVATLLAFVAGGLAGLATGLLYTKGKIPVLLAGILVMTAIYSINLRVMGKSNVSLLNTKNLFTSEAFNNLPPYFNSVLIGIVVVIITFIILTYFLQTDLGQAFIATGDNEAMAKSLGIKTDRMKIIGLVVSNGFVGLSGGLLAQNNGYADVNMGLGVIVIGLAAVVIGEVVYGELTMSQRLIAVIFGSILYRIVILLVLQLGFNTNDLKLISAIILALALMLPALKEKLNLSQVLKRGVSTHETAQKPTNVTVK